MDINLFKKSLASKQNLLKEASGYDPSKAASKSLDNTNKFLDKADEALMYALDHLGDYIEYAKDGKLLSSEESRAINQAFKEIEALRNQLLKSGNKVPVA